MATQEAAIGSSSEAIASTETLRDGRHRRRPGRPCGRLLPEEAGAAVRDPRRERADRRLLADAHLELAPPLYSGTLRRAAGLVVSGARLVVSHCARGG